MAFHASLVRTSVCGALALSILAAFGVGAPGHAQSTATSLTSAPNPTTFSQPATFTATVIGSVAGAPTGSVTFREGTAILGSATLDAVGASQGIAAGLFQSCALTNVGGLKCWGNNSNGELGDGTGTTRLSPVDVAGLSTGVISAASGRYHTCAATSTGGVKCWGYNGQGQLGNGTTVSSLAPVDVSGLSGSVTAVVAGPYHTCAVMSDGALKCWGYNGAGQLGDGTTVDRTQPVSVSGLAGGVVAGAAGLYHSCALTIAGAVKCWGNNAYGQLGDGSVANSLAPVDVAALGGAATALSAGDLHSCAATGAGGVRCWGYNGAGGLGDGTTATRTTPVSVTGLANIRTVAAGKFHTCALASTGAMTCWGNNNDGELGDGTTTTRLSPVAVSGFGSGVGAIAAGGFHSCAVLASGTVRCWGYNGFGGIGDGTTVSRSVPTDTLNLVAQAAASARFITSTLGAGSHDIVAEYGGDASHSASSGTVSHSVLAVATLATLASQPNPSLGGQTVTLTATVSAPASRPTGSVIFSDGAIALATRPLLPTPTRQIGGGNFHSCVVTGAGGVKCWGANGEGQLGNGTTPTPSLAPVDVSGLSSGIADLAVGTHHVCALTTAGGVKCWGWNGSGQLGDGSTTNRSTPVDVVGLTSGVAAIAAGNTHTCAIAAGNVVCWGANQEGQLGDGRAGPGHAHDLGGVRGRRQQPALRHRAGLDVVTKRASVRPTCCRCGWCRRRTQPSSSGCRLRASKFRGWPWRRPGQTGPKYRRVRA